MAKRAEANVTADFTPNPNYDGTDIPPEAPASKWTGIIEEVKKGATQPKPGFGSFPMLTLTVKITGNKDRKLEKQFKNRKLKDRLIFPAPGADGERFMKMHCRECVEQLGLDPAKSLPRKGIKTWADLEPLIEALTGVECEFWTDVRPDKRTNEDRTEVAWREPYNAGIPAGSKDDEDEDDEDEEDEDEKPAKGSGKAKSGKVVKGKVVAGEDEDDEEEDEETEEDEDEDAEDSDDEDDDDDEEEDEEEKPAAKKAAGGKRK